MELLKGILEYNLGRRGMICWVFWVLSGIAIAPVGAVAVRDIGEEAEKHIEEADRYIFTEPSQAVSYANSAILKAERAGDDLQLVAAYISLGRAYINLGAFDQAFEAFYNAYDKCQESDSTLLADVNVNLANLYRIFTDYNRAFEFAGKAMGIYEQRMDSVGIASCLNIRGLIFISLNKNDSAEINFKRALMINRRLKRPKEITKNLNNLCLYEGNTAEKIEMLQEAIHINKELGANWSVGENFNNLGTQYFYARNYKKALECLTEAMGYAEELRARELICDNYRYQTWVYTALGDYKKAYENLMHLYETEKELLSEKKIRRIEHEVADRRFQEQQRELNIQQKELRIKNLRNKIIIISGVFFGILVFFVFAVMRSRHRKKIQWMETEKKLEAKEKERIGLRLNKTEEERDDISSKLSLSKKELTNLACHIRSRNELLDKIKTMLRECYKDMPEEFKGPLKGVNTFITCYQDQENDLDILTKDIDRINTEFITRLTTLHPDLSTKEKQLASLLRIDLSTKEIALLIGAVPKSVNMARYRLRKRLNLETDDSLSDYIKTI